MYNYDINNSEYDECVARGACSIPPSVAAIQEVLLIIIRQCAFYITNLKSFNDITEDDKFNLINMFSNAVSSTAYSDNQLSYMVENAYKKLSTLRKFYNEKCSTFDIQKKYLHDNIILTSGTKLSDIISLGEKYFKIRYAQNQGEQLHYRNLLSLIIKNTASNLVALHEYGIKNSDTIDVIINSLNLLNKNIKNLLKYKEAISDLTNKNVLLIEKLYFVQKEYFGEIAKTEVNLSTKNAKAILVSGTNLPDLYNLLKFTEDEDIDIYTHDNMIIANAYSKFKQFKNLKGQFGNCRENCVLDFAVFPGAILITKNSNINTDYLYRGRIFTTSNIQPQGVSLIKNNDFSSLVLSAKEAKGFAKGQNKPRETVGYNRNEIENIFSKLAEDIESGKIKKVIILDSTGFKNNYYKALVSKLSSSSNNKVFVLSFSYDLKDIDRGLTINCGENQSLIYEVLSILNQSLSLDNPNIVFMFSKCDSRTISSMIYLHNIGAKNIHLFSCSPNLINPSLKTFIMEKYNIKTLTSPETDLKNLIGED